MFISHIKLEQEWYFTVAPWGFTMLLIPKKNLKPLDIQLVHRIMRNFQYSNEKTIAKNLVSNGLDKMSVFFAIKAAKIMLQEWEE